MLKYSQELWAFPTFFVKAMHMRPPNWILILLYVLHLFKSSLHFIIFKKIQDVALLKSVNSLDSLPLFQLHSLQPPYYPILETVAPSSLLQIFNWHFCHILLPLLHVGFTKYFAWIHEKNMKCTRKNIHSFTMFMRAKRAKHVSWYMSVILTRGDLHKFI